MNDSPTHYRPAAAPQLYFWIILTLAALALFPGLHRGGLSGYDDALYAHEGKEMVHGGSLWNITYNGELNFEYPPLFIWIEAASIKVFGVNDFAAKLPAALTGFGTIAALYFLTRELTGDAWMGLISALVLATTQPFLKYATHAMTDVPFTFFFTVALLCYVKGLRSPGYLALAGIPIACALLTRSILGVTIFALIASHLLFTRRYSLLWSPFTVAGVVIAILPPFLWGALEYKMHGAAFLNGHLAFISNKVASTGAHLTFSALPYLKELLKYYWPWLPLLAVGLYLQILVIAKTRDTAAVLSVAWALWVVIPLTFLGTKYGRYLMPAFPAFAILTAAALCRWLSPNRAEHCLRIACGVFFLVICGTIFFPAKERGLDMRLLAPVAQSHSDSSQRVLLYTYGDAAYDYQNQFLWYADRHSQLVTDLQQIETKWAQGAPFTAIVDTPSYQRLTKKATDGSDRNLEILAQSEKFTCFRANGEGR